MSEFEYNPPPDAFKDSSYEAAVVKYPAGSWVFITTTRQIGMVEAVRPSADGPRVKVVGMGSVPLAEIRPATEEEIRQRDA